MSIEKSNSVMANLAWAKGDDTIALPDPRFCNLKLNVIRVLHASGAADIFRKYFEDSDSADMRSFVLGASVEMDNKYVPSEAPIDCTI